MIEDADQRVGDLVALILRPQKVEYISVLFFRFCNSPVMSLIGEELR